MKGGFRTLLRKFCLESTILGLKYFYLYPNVISRCFWLVTMLAVLLLAGVLTWLLYTRFEEMPTRVTIENQFEWAHDLPYPSITLCSPNQISLNFMNHFNKTLVDGNLTIDLEQVLPKLIGFYDNVFEVTADNMVQLQSLLELNRYTVSEIMASIPQSCEDFLKLCYFKGVRYPNCLALFQPILTATHGLCCTFNNIYHFDNKRNVLNKGFKVENVTEAGHHNGLIVVTDYNPDDAVDGTILNAGGVVVMFSDYKEFPADYESSVLESAVETYHTIQAIYTYCSDEVKGLPFWSRNCYMEDEHQLPYFRDYHKSNCDLTCLVLAVKDYCNCTLFYMPKIRSIENICDLTEIACIMDVRARMSEWLTVSNCDCPRDCESRRYKVELNVGNLGALPHMIVDTFAGMKFNQSTSVMKFHFRNMVYVKQKQETVMSIITFASNLGGVFGLCLGCSVMSVLEILFYTFSVIKNHIKRRVNQKNAPKPLDSKIYNSFPLRHRQKF